MSHLFYVHACVHACVCVCACMHVRTGACKLYTTTFGQCRFSDCSKAMKFTPFCHPSHWLLPCPPSCVKNSPQQTIPEQTISNCLLTCPPTPNQHSLTPPCSVHILSVHVSVCGCGCCVQEIQYYKSIIIFFGGVMTNVYIFVELVKHGLLTYDGEIWCYRNGHYYYYYVIVTCMCVHLYLEYAVFSFLVYSFLVNVWSKLTNVIHCSYENNPH